MPRKHTDEHGEERGRRPRPVIESAMSLKSALRRPRCSTHVSVFFRLIRLLAEDISCRGNTRTNTEKRGGVVHGLSSNPQCH
jgi:hypothetical protein